MPRDHSEPANEFQPVTSPDAARFSENIASAVRARRFGQQLTPADLPFWDGKNNYWTVDPEAETGSVYNLGERYAILALRYTGQIERPSFIVGVIRDIARAGHMDTMMAWGFLSAIGNTLLYGLRYAEERSEERARFAAEVLAAEATERSERARRAAQARWAKARHVVPAIAAE